MRVPELPLEPAERRDGEPVPYEDEDRIHELVKLANEYIEKRHKPQFVGPSAELMPGGEALDWCCQCGCEIRSANDGHYDADLCEWTCDGCYYELYDSEEYDNG